MNAGRKSSRILTQNCSKLDQI